MKLSIEDIILLVLALAERELSLLKLLVVLSELSEVSGIEFEVDVIGSRAIARAVRWLKEHDLVRFEENLLKLSREGSKEAQRVLKLIREHSYVCLDPDIVIETSLFLQEVKRSLGIYVKLSDIEAFARRLEQILRRVYYYDNTALELGLSAVKNLKSCK